ncbi:MAG: enoyl-CoA hydratase-related protein [Acidimicrobiales bacterium]
MAYQTILWEAADGVGRLTLNRPDQRNGVTGLMLQELYDAVRRAATDDDLRVVVLTGAGGSFCVGADLRHYADGAADAGAPETAFDVTRLLHELPAVTVAAVNGAAAGAGFGWACACDLRFATRSAVFNSAFLDVAVAGDMAGPWTLPRLVGAAKARELYFLPGRFGADEAHRIGLVVDVFDDDAFTDGIEAVVARLAAAAPLAIRGMKANFLDGETLSLADYVAVETQRHVQIAASRDTAEAFRAFVDKRKPHFEGR